MSAGTFRDRATIIQQKTGRPVQFEILSEARKSLRGWLDRRGGTIRDFVFPSRIDYLGHVSTRQFESGSSEIGDLDRLDRSGRDGEPIACPFLLAGSQQRAEPDQSGEVACRRRRRGASDGHIIGGA